MELFTPIYNPNADIIHISLVPLTKCNFRCHYCYMSDSGYNISHNTKILESIFKKLNEIPKLELSILGGEPSLIKDLNRYIEMLEPREFLSVMVYSNGSNLNLLDINCDLNLSYHTDYHSQNYLNNFKKIISHRQNLKHELEVSIVKAESNSQIIQEVLNELKNPKVRFIISRDFSGDLDPQDLPVPHFLNSKLLSGEKSLEILKVKPKLCKLNQFVIFPDGNTMLNCLDIPLGNFENVDFSPRLTKCLKSKCVECFWNVPRYF